MSVATAVAELAKVDALPGAKIEPSFLWQLWQEPEHLIRYQMEATGLRFQLKCYLLYHQNFILNLYYSKPRHPCAGMADSSQCVYIPSLHTT